MNDKELLKTDRLMWNDPVSFDMKDKDSGKIKDEKDREGVTR